MCDGPGGPLAAERAPLVSDGVSAQLPGHSMCNSVRKETTYVVPAAAFYLNALHSFISA